MEKARPLGKVTPRYDEGETYPHAVLVPMTDGRVLRYELKAEDGEPHPNFINAMEILERMPMYGGRKYRRAQKEPGL